MTVYFTRDLDTRDKYDFAIESSKSTTPMVYAFCAPPWCNGVEEAHSPNDWNIIEVDLFGSVRKLNRTAVSCSADSPDLCTCSELIRLGVISSFDDCTREAAVDYCEEHGACPRDKEQK